MKKVISVLLTIILLATSFLPASHVYGAPVPEATVESQEYDGHSYQVYLPVGYDGANATKYPSVYLMPKDGLSSQGYIDDGIVARFNQIMASNQGLDMIVIMPDYNPTDNFSGLLPSLVADVEAKYNVIKDANYRGILGVNVGGYMAYASVLLDATSGALFKAVGSHAGNFTSNIWTSKGSVYDAATAITRTNMIKKYYYLDGASGDSITTVAGSTSDIGTTIMKKTNPYYGTQWQAYATPDTNYAEYSVRDGKGNTDFYLASLERSLNRFSKCFAKNLITGVVTLSPQAVTASKNTIDATIGLTLTNVLQNYTSEIPTVNVTVSMINPNSGDVLYTMEKPFSDMVIGTAKTEVVTLNKSDMAPGINTTVVVEAKVMGMSFEISRQSLIRVQETGTADDEQLVDLMGDWYFNAYKNYSASDTTVVDLDRIANIVPDTYTKWDVVQPALGWWTSSFSTSLLGSGNRACYAWYVRTFDLSADFPKENLLFTVGKFDEANEVYLNGTLIGSTGYKYTGDVGVYDGSNPWDVNCVYEFDTSLLNYGGNNTIAIRMCNSSGGGGWYEGPVGLYSMAAYNKASGKPSTYAPSSATEKVMDLVSKQKTAIETGNVSDYATTLSPEFFHSGYDKERKVDQVQNWVTTYTNIKVEDTGVGVFLDGTVYNYQAQRKITGLNSEGVQVTIFEGEASEYYIDTAAGVIQYGDHSRFYVDTYETDAINGTKQTLTARVYLPEGYFENEDRYPTAYLFHGINSSSKTYEIDKIDKVLDQYIAEGTIDKMVVVLPDDPTKTSFWKDAYANMVTEDLIPTIDARYRTIQDARYRFTAGCSMGGAGSFGIGLTNPNLFTGAISFYGALSYNNIVSNTESLSADYLSRYGLYIASGNMDNYSFYDVAGQMSRILNTKGVAHYFYIDNGKHDSIFYLPLFDDAFAYMSNRIADITTDASLVNGSLTYAKSNGSLSISYNLAVSDAISSYLETVPASIYTKDENPSIIIPMTILIEQNNQIVASATSYFNTKTAASWTDTITLGNADFDIKKAYNIRQYATVLNDTKLLSSYLIEAASATDVAGVELNASTLSLQAGTTSQLLVATVAPENATNKNVTWTSSNPSVARVSQSGLVTPVAIGATTISVQTMDGNYIATCQVTVTAAPETIIAVSGAALSATTLEFAVSGSALSLLPIITPDNATNKDVVWSSSNPSVATVSDIGLVTAKAKGTAIITITTVDGGYIATCEVTVTGIKIPVSSIAVSSAYGITRIEKGSTLQMSAIVLPGDAYNASVTWGIIGGNGIATIDANGLLVTTGTGTITVQAVAKDGSGVVGTMSIIVYAASTDTTYNPTPVTTTPSPTPTPTPAPSIDENGTLGVEILLSKDDINNTDKEVKIPITTQLLEQFKNKDIESININLKSSEDLKDELLNNDIIIDANLLEAAKNAEKSISVTVRGADDRENYTWTFSGDELASTTKDMTEVNLSLKLAQVEEVSGLGEMIGKDAAAKAMVIEFSHEGVLPAQASVHIYVGNQEGIKAGSKIFLYHYNPVSGKLETLPNSSKYVVDEKGYITINIVHCSDYVALTAKPSTDSITSLRSQIMVSTVKKTLYVGGKNKTTQIKVELPLTLELVSSFAVTPSSSALGGVTITYTSDNEKVAKVSKEGVITAVRSGKAVITTKITLYSGKTKTVKTTITVK